METTTSESVAKIAEALAAAQGEMSGARKKSENPFFTSRYADLASIIGAIREPLSKNGIAHVQLPGSDEDSLYVDTLLIHSSGEWLRSRIRMNPPDVFHKESREWVSGDTPQGRGSVISYMRRYALQAMCGLEAEDDDGEKGMRRDSEPRPKGLPPTKPLPQGTYQEAKTATLPATAPAKPIPVDGKGINWRQVRCHLGTAGGRVNGKELDKLTQTSIEWLGKELLKIKEPTQTDNLLKAALAMREAELSPTPAQPELGSSRVNLESLRAKAVEAKIPLDVIAKVSRNIGGTAQTFDAIPEDECGFLVANWKDTLEGVKFETDNLPQ